MLLSAAQSARLTDAINIFCFNNIPALTGTTFGEEAWKALG